MEELVLMNELIKLGRCSVVLHTMFGHLDGYNGKKPNTKQKILQSKVVLNPI
jgi:hypothetical protein